MDFNAKLADAVLKQISKPFNLDESFFYFIENSLGIRQLDNVLDILQNIEHPDRYMLIELIFYPSQDALINIEPFIDIYLNSFDIKLIEEYVLANLKKICLAYDADFFYIEPCRDMVNTYIKKFHFDKPLSKDLILFMKQNLPVDLFSIIKFKLRNFSVTFKKSHIDFLKIFIEIFKKDKDLIWLLELVLNVFYEFKNVDDLYLQFVYKKNHLLQMLKKVEQIHKMLQEETIEKIIMQRQAILSIDKNKTLKEIEGIDKISEKIFKKEALPLEQINFF